MKETSLSRRSFMASTAGLAATGAVLGLPSLARAAAPIRIGVGSDPVFAGFFVAEKEGWANVPPGTRSSLYANEEYQKAAPFAKMTLDSINAADPKNHI